MASINNHNRSAVMGDTWYYGALVLLTLLGLTAPVTNDGVDPKSLYNVNPRFRGYHHESRKGFIGEKLRLNCQARGFPPPYIHWFRADPGSDECSTKRLDEDKLQPRIRTKKYTLYFTGLRAEDAGKWCCKVWNKHGQLFRHFYINIIDLGRFQFFKQYSEHCKEKGEHSEFPIQILQCICPKIKAFHKPDCGDMERISSEVIASHNLTSEAEEFLHDWVYGYSKMKQEEAKHSYTGSGSDEDGVDKPALEGHPMLPDKEMAADQPSERKVIPPRSYRPDLSRPDGSSGLSDHEIIPDFYRDQDLIRKFNHDRAPYFATKEQDKLKVVAQPAGTELKLNCAAHGEPAPVATWFKNGVKIEPGMGRGLASNYRMHKHVLIMKDAVKDDAGIYKCVIKNTYGQISFNFSVTVVERYTSKPIMHPDLPKNVTVAPGGNATFECQVISDLHPHIDWGYVDYNNTSDFVTNIFDNIGYIGPDRLEMINVTYSNAGWYVCIAGNSIGMTYQRAYLSVEESTDADVSELEPEENSQTGIIYVVIAFVFLAGITVVVLVYLKHRDRKKLQSRIQNAHQVYPTRKKVQIIRQDSATGSLAPLISITSSTGDRNRLTTDLSAISEYELPLDEKWEIDRKSVTLKTILGTGAFGQVWHAELDWTNCAAEVAVKMLKVDAGERELTDLVSEMELMKNFRTLVGHHPNIINLIGCCTQDGPLYVLVELCENGNLRDWLRAHRLPDPETLENSESLCSSGYEEPNELRKLRLSKTKQVLTQRDLVSFALQIGRGMEVLESKNFIHRDLAARNILVTADLTMKIADFGLARDLHYVDYYKKKTDGRLPVKWMAPEALFDRIYTSKSDVWSYGIILWEIWTMGGTPYPSIPVEFLFQFLKEGKRNDQPMGCMEPIWQLMLECWDIDPHRRPMFRKVITDLDYILSESVSDEYTIALDESNRESLYSASATDSLTELRQCPPSASPEHAPTRVSTAPPTYAQLRKLPLSSTTMNSFHSDSISPLDTIFPCLTDSEKALKGAGDSRSSKNSIISDPSPPQEDCNGRLMPHNHLAHPLLKRSMVYTTIRDDRDDVHSMLPPLEKCNSNPEERSPLLGSTVGYADIADNQAARLSAIIDDPEHTPIVGGWGARKMKLLHQHGPAAHPRSSSELFSMEVDDGDNRSTSTSQEASYSSESVGMKSSLSSRPSSTPSDEDEGVNSCSSPLLDSDEHAMPIRVMTNHLKPSFSSNPAAEATVPVPIMTASNDSTGKRNTDDIFNDQFLPKTNIYSKNKTSKSSEKKSRPAKKSSVRSLLPRDPAEHSYANLPAGGCKSGTKVSLPERRLLDGFTGVVRRPVTSPLEQDSFDRDDSPSPVGPFERRLVGPAPAYPHQPWQFSPSAIYSDSSGQFTASNPGSRSGSNPREVELRVSSSSADSGTQESAPYHNMGALGLSSYESKKCTDIIMTDAMDAIGPPSRSVSYGDGQNSGMNLTEKISTAELIMSSRESVV